jgi:hypothetical protein
MWYASSQIRYKLARWRAPHSRGTFEETARCVARVEAAVEER